MHWNFRLTTPKSPEGDFTTELEFDVTGYLPLNLLEGDFATELEFDVTGYLPLNLKGLP